MHVLSQYEGMSPVLRLVRAPERGGTGGLRVVQDGEPATALRLCDELAVLTAVHDVMHCRPTDVRATLAHVAQVAASALDCQLVVAWLPAEDRPVVVSRGARLQADERDLRPALQQLRTTSIPRWCQHSASDPLPELLRPEGGAASHAVLPLGAPAEGLLLLFRTRGGFSPLTRTIGAKVAEAGGVLVHGSVLRADLQRQLLTAETAARRDTLTGLGNRLAWDEALMATATRVEAGECASVLVVDLNELKRVNDEHGHVAGDHFLQRAATALGSVARRGDTVARLGGDEFGLLLPGVDAAAAERVVDRLRAAFALSGSVGSVPLSAAFGAATCEPGGSLRSAAYRADSAMYVDKQAARDRR